MPVINVQMLGTATREQKAQIIAEFTDTMVRVLGKNPDYTFVIINEKSDEDWGHLGRLVADTKKEKLAAESQKEAKS